MILSDAISEFLLACSADGLAPATVRWYTSILKAYNQAFTGREVESLTVREHREYIVALRNQEPYQDAPQKPPQGGKLADASISSHVIALHAFWGWIVREYGLPNAMKNIKRPRRRKPQPKALAPDDFIRLLEATGDNLAGIRDRALLCFLADTGCRLGGLLSLKIEHLQIDQRRAIVREKGADVRVVVFTRFTARMLARWLLVRTAATDHVFVNLHTGAPLTESGVTQALKRLKKRSGVTGRVNPHSFRHNFARAYLTNGGDLATLAMLLGHKDISTTTDYYAVFSEDELAELHEKFSPLNSMRKSQQ